jgi:hypothetical protein
MNNKVCERAWPFATDGAPLDRHEIIGTGERPVQVSRAFADSAQNVGSAFSAAASQHAQISGTHKKHANPMILQENFEIFMLLLNGAW